MDNYHQVFKKSKQKTTKKRKQQEDARKRKCTLEIPDEQAIEEIVGVSLTAKGKVCIKLKGESRFIDITHARSELLDTFLITNWKTFLPIPLPTTTLPDNPSNQNVTKVVSRRLRRVASSNFE